jgi:DNA-binding CsgD family transcriptional regulator
MHACADAAEARLDGVDRLRAQLAERATGVSLRSPLHEAYAAVFAAESARASILTDIAAWDAASAAWDALGQPYPTAYALLQAAKAAVAVGVRDFAGPQLRRGAADSDSAWSQLGDGVGDLDSAEPRLRRRSGDPDSVGVRLRRAAGLADQVGAVPLLQRITRLARQVKVELPPVANAATRAGEPARFGLTDREREVLRLVAAGRGNRDIAAELFISPKTVSVHVSNILAKLGAATRTEAAATAHRLHLLETRPSA